MSRQHLWMYRDGVVILECDFVSGDTSKGNTTSGSLFLYYKDLAFVLKSDTPGDSYETPVTYWMPLTEVSVSMTPAGEGLSGETFTPTAVPTASEHAHLGGCPDV